MLLILLQYTSHVHSVADSGKAMGLVCVCLSVNNDLVSWYWLCFILIHTESPASTN